VNGQWWVGVGLFLLVSFTCSAPVLVRNRYGISWMVTWLTDPPAEGQGARKQGAGKQRAGMGADPAVECKIPLSLKTCMTAGVTDLERGQRGQGRQCYGEEWEGATQADRDGVGAIILPTQGWRTFLAWINEEAPC